MLCWSFSKQFLHIALNYTYNLLIVTTYFKVDPALRNFKCKRPYRPYSCCEGLEFGVLGSWDGLSALCV